MCKLLLNVTCFGVVWSYTKLATFLMPFHTYWHTLLLRSECMLGVWISLSFKIHASAVSSSVTDKWGWEEGTAVHETHSPDVYTNTQQRNYIEWIIHVYWCTVEEAFKPNPICKGCTDLCVVTQTHTHPVTLPLVLTNSLSGPICYCRFYCPPAHQCTSFVYMQTCR